MKYNFPEKRLWLMEPKKSRINFLNKTKRDININNMSIIPDRAEAIREAINFARKGDMVIIAGKGHETYQTWKDWVVPFDDSEVAREVLEELYGTYKRW